jgi:hypothetical protein
MKPELVSSREYPDVQFDFSMLYSLAADVMILSDIYICQSQKLFVRTLY